MQPDKRKHLIAGACVGAWVVALLFAHSLLGLPAAILFAGALVGVGYEMLQAYRHEGTPDPWDALATFAGSAAVALAVWAYQQQ